MNYKEFEAFSLALKKLLQNGLVDDAIEVLDVASSKETESRKPQKEDKDV